MRVYKCGKCKGEKKTITFCTMPDNCHDTLCHFIFFVVILADVHRTSFVSFFFTHPQFKVRRIINVSRFMERPLRRTNKNTKTLTQVDNGCGQQREKNNTGTCMKLSILLQNGFFPAFD